MNEKIIFFDEWCPKCKYADKIGTDDPCNECLTIPARLGSHKPVNFVKKGGKSMKKQL